MENLNQNIKAMLNAFKESALWSNNLDDLTIFDFPETEDQQLVKVIKKFIALLDYDQLPHLMEDPDQFGHCLALELNGHGAGFFDSDQECVSRITDQLESLPHFDSIETDMNDQPVINWYNWK